MQIATLGGLIKDHRLKKRLSQLEVSLRIGWSDATRLSKIEQGRVSKPTRKTLDKIMDALELDVHQRGEMLRVGTRIPEVVESKKVMNVLIKEIQHVNYPILIVDTFWTTYYVNDKFIKLFNLSKECINYINSNHPNWLELLFCTDYINSYAIKAGSSEKRISEYKNYQISQFRYEMSEYVTEAWFIGLIKNLKNNPEFKEKWENLMDKNNSDYFWYDYEFYEIINNGQILKFHVCTMRPSLDPRFNYIVHFPVDKQTIDFFEK